MPTGTVEHPDDAFVGMAGSHLIQKQLHARPVDTRQDQRVQDTVQHRHSGIGVFLRHHRPANRPEGLGTPAAANISDPAKPRLVLEHEPDGTFPRPLPVECGEDFGEFFSVLLRSRIAFRVPLIRRPFAPTMTMQQVIDRGQRRLAP